MNTNTAKTLHGFQLVKEQQIHEIKTQAQLWVHEKTGARLMSLINDDENKCFGINFRTPPSDSTGVAHILEHSVLCGSRKYPLKEPFIELAKGSLNTFLNAFTYPDKTCYPVASTNLQDFYNLVDVYLDAALYPRLTPYTLAQEGWHHELENVDDPLVYKGVVFNEMKGAYGSPESILYEEIQHSLFPDNTYSVDSGGDPKHIPDLTFEQLQEFHQTYYHPSNSWIMFYGDDDPGRRLEILNEWLSEFERRPANSDIKLQQPFTQSRSSTCAYAVSEDSPNADKGMLCVNWMLGEIVEPEKLGALQVLSHILMSTTASPLRKALIDSGLGEDVTGGMSDQLRQLTFSAGLKGIAPGDATHVESLVLDTLHTLARDGVDPEMVDAAVNTIEFSLRENNTGSFPRGLSLMVNTLSSWLHGHDPMEHIGFEKPLAAFKANLAEDPQLFQNLIRHYLLENTHRTTVTLLPDKELEQRRNAEELARLQAARAAMTEADLQQVVAHTKELKRRQETPDPPEVLAMIPTLKLADLDKQIKTIPRQQLSLAGTTTLYHDLFTNGIVYLNIGLNLHLLPQDLLPYISLFGRSLLQMGTDQQDFVRLTQRIGSKTGGVWQQPLATSVWDSPAASPWLFLRGKALPSQFLEMLAIMREVLLTARLDNQERFRQIAREEKARLESHVVSGGSGFVSARLRSHFTEAGWLGEQMGGISYVFFIRELVERIETDWPAVQAALERMRGILLQRGSMLCNVTLDGDNWQRLRPGLEEFLASLPEGTGTPADWRRTGGAGFEGLAAPLQVNHVGKAANVYQLGYQRHGSSSVITHYINTTWLWERVRMQGGAYGGFCGLDSISGVFNFGSYRDPNLLETVDNFDATAGFLRTLELGAAEITRSIIGTISSMDGYQLPDAKGWTSMTRYLAGITDELRQQTRDEVLGTGLAQFRAFAEVLDQVSEKGLVVVMGSEDAIAVANSAKQDWLKVTRVL